MFSSFSYSNEIDVKKTSNVAEFMIIVNQIKNKATAKKKFADVKLLSGNWMSMWWWIEYVISTAKNGIESFNTYIAYVPLSWLLMTRDDEIY